MAKRREFLVVYEKGRKIQSRTFVLYAMENDLPFHRLGITVSKKIGNAVARNRVKRRIREVFRREKPAHLPSMDLVVNARKSAVQVEFAALREELRSVLNRLGRRAGSTR